jgi:quercetin dioxygenase-like cupin family protein
VKVTGAETDGAIGIIEATSPPGFGPPRHIHHSCDEWFYVLDGEFQFLVGDDLVHAQAGAFVYVPRGTVHAPKVVGSKPGKVLSGFVPGGGELAFEEFSRLDVEHPDFESQAQAIATKYDSEFVGPPL